MSQIPITVKIDADVKQQAQQLAKKLGLSLSSIVENKLREVIRELKVIFEEEFVPNEKTAKELETIEADIKANCNISGPFNSFEELERYLSGLSHAGSNS
jgi:addiction module RelB/DinJ family antitoxin